MRVLVTGAAGFIGTRLIQAMSEDHAVTGMYHSNYGPMILKYHNKRKNHAVTGMAHRTKSPDHTGFRGDITDPDLKIPGEFDVVIHLAALTPLERDKAKQRRINYDGALNLFSHVRDKAKKFVYASGLGVFGDTAGVTITESTPIRPHTNFAKIRTEAGKSLQIRCKDAGIEFCTAYMGDVYGRNGWFGNHIINRIRKNRFKIPGGGKYLKSFIHVDDAASSINAIAEKGRGAYIVTDSNPVPFRDVINYCADKMGRKRPGSVPAILARAMLGKDAVALFVTETKASNAKILEIADMKYPSYKEGLDEVFSGMQDAS